LGSFLLEMIDYIPHTKFSMLTLYCPKFPLMYINDCGVHKINNKQKSGAKKSKRSE